MKYLLPLAALIVVCSLGFNYLMLLRVMSKSKTIFLLSIELIVSLALTPVINLLSLLVSPFLRIVTPDLFWGTGDEGWNAVILMSVFFGQLFVILFNYLYYHKKSSEI